MTKIRALLQTLGALEQPPSTMRGEKNQAVPKKAVASCHNNFSQQHTTAAHQQSPHEQFQSISSLHHICSRHTNSRRLGLASENAQNTADFVCVSPQSCLPRQCPQKRKRWSCSGQGWPLWAACSFFERCPLQLIATATFNERESAEKAVKTLPLGDREVVAAICIICRYAEHFARNRMSLYHLTFWTFSDQQGLISTPPLGTLGTNYSSSSWQVLDLCPRNGRSTSESRQLTLPCWKVRPRHGVDNRSEADAWHGVLGRWFTRKETPPPRWLGSPSGL